MPTPEAIAASFRELDFHDDTLTALRVSPPQPSGDASRSIVEIQLLQPSEKKLRTVRFSECANLRVAMDFDVLAQNLPPNTSGVDAHTNSNRMRDLIQSQKKDWGVEYASGVMSPLTRKLAATADLVAFRVQFFGGAIDVIARDYEVETVDQR